VNIYFGELNGNLAEFEFDKFEVGEGTWTKGAGAKSVK
jgi:hypothetical protein